MKRFLMQCCRRRRPRSTYKLLILTFGTYVIFFFYWNGKTPQIAGIEADFNMKAHKSKDIFRRDVYAGDSFNKDENTDKCPNWRPFVFIKTHKTGSTTVRWITERYIERHNLKKEPQFLSSYVGGFPGRMQLKFMYYLNNRTNTSDPCSDVVINAHSRLNLTLIKEVMPRRTRVFTIIRNPWGQFQSSFNFFYAWLFEEAWRLGFSLGDNCFIYPYLYIASGRNIDVLEYLDLVYENLNPQIPFFFRSKNPQAFDLGVDPNTEDEEEIKREIEKLDAGMDLVMINEYMDESLILLKSLLNMTWDDLSQEDDKVRSYSQHSLENYPERQAKFEKMFKLDVLLYRHFNATFWRKVDEYGREEMNKDLTELRKLRTIKQAINSTEVKRNFERNQFYSQTFFNIIPKTSSETFLVKVLQRKLPKQSDKKLQHDLARYMVDNHGGCPI
ncbi:unnamed protein product [Clavelina lepadiformis]|uniref:Uncharacterized protein n=1 Tax=Clavelina lepadiformis TaxID=159417 RepID=A0ABP0GD70_CLALP